jgi:protein-disulfide isomerase
MRTFLMLCLLVAPGPGRAAAAAAADPATPVAQIQGRTLRLRDLQPAIAALIADSQRDLDAASRPSDLIAARTRARQADAALNRVIDERVLALEAAAHATTPDALLHAVPVPAVSDAEIRAAYDAEGGNLPPLDAIRPQIQEYLGTAAGAEAQYRYLHGLRGKYRARVLWKSLREPIDASGPAIGPADAPVTIVEYSDFQCPYCARLEPTLRRIRAAYPDRVRLVFRHYPLRQLHANAAGAAAAAACAARQDRFWEMHDALFLRPARLEPAALHDKAAGVGLDMAAFDACLTSGQGAAAVKVDETAAESLMLVSTPSSFVNGRYVDGAQPYAVWEALIDDELGRRDPPGQ